MKKFNKSIINYMLNGIDMLLSGAVMYILYLFLPRNIWIISEREDQAQDNGIEFFKYLNKEKTQINSWYLLNQDSKKIDYVSKYGKVLIKGSFKHKLYFLKSEVIASTEKNVIEPWGSRMFYKYFQRLFPKKLKVFLQHGILDKDVSSVYGKNVSDIDVFVTSTRNEKEFVKNVFKYEDFEIANVGIARYDNLFKLKQNENKENLILYMPTWRRYLIDLANNDDAYIKHERDEFIKSTYYNEIQAFINDKYLNEVLEKSKYKLLFVTHHGINIFKDLFYTYTDNVQIFRSEDIEISELLAKSKIFITDYSSIHFDSAYMGNRNVYYQFDYDKFDENHAGKSYFDYERDGFGKVTHNRDELVSEIESLIDNDNVENKFYQKRINSFFEYNDSENSERLFTFILERLKCN